MRKMLGRCAVIVMPMEPFIEWLKTQSEWVDADDPQLNEPSVYLTSHPLDDIVLVAEWEESEALEVFKRELERWVPDRRSWPELSLERFYEWFCIDYVTHVHDIGGELMLDCDPGDEIPF